LDNKTSLGFFPSLALTGRGISSGLLKNFQESAVQSLKQTFYNLWKLGNRRIPLVFKSPTGSGKTIMVAEFLRRISGDMQFEADKAFVWVSFNEESYLQSKKKLFDYFNSGVSNLNLLDLNDLGNGKLKRNEVFFINWQKVVSRAKDNRVLRTEGEANTTFDEFIQKTHADGREIVLIVDECHLMKTTDLAQEIIDIIDPRIEICVSATPLDQDIIKSVQEGGFISVKHQDVVEEGLIKEQIKIMPKEEIDSLELRKEMDLDSLLLELAIQKKKEIENDYRQLGLNINPLVLIQLPNDETAIAGAKGQNKLSFVKEFLDKKKVCDGDTAIWLSEKKENLAEITTNTSNVDYLIFKQAAATGWDCPRAQIIVMFREIQSPTFRTQVLGRILRMPEAYHYPSSLLNNAYVYTSYEQKEIEIQQQKIGENKSAIYKSELRIGLENISLPSTFFKRGTYNDLGDSFQKTFIKVANESFGIAGNEIGQQGENKLKEKGLDILATQITNHLIVDAKVEVYDDFIAQLEKSAEHLDHKASFHDTEKLYNLLCFKEINIQEEQVKKFVPERSWSKLKRSLNVWLKEHISIQNPPLYGIICNDLLKENSSVLRPIIAKALEAYKPIRNKEEEEKLAKIKEPLTFSLSDEYRFTDDYEEFELQKGTYPIVSAIKPFFLHKKATSGLEKNFIRYVENNAEKIDWWFKNGDYGRQNLAIEYKDSNEELRLFYPDFIIKQGNKIGLLDTKGGMIAKDAKEKAEALQKYIKKFNEKGIFEKFEYKSLNIKLWGGIITESGGLWKLNNQKDYKFNSNDLSSWVNFKL